MNTAMVRLAAVLGVLLSSSLCPAVGTPMLITVTPFCRPAGLSDVARDAVAALQPIDGISVPVDPPGDPILALAGSTASRDTGFNLRTYKTFCYGSEDGLISPCLTEATTAAIDTAEHPDLLRVNCLGLAGAGGPGDRGNYTFDAVNAVHPTKQVASDLRLPTPGTIFLIAIGASLVSCLRWRRTL